MSRWIAVLMLLVMPFACSATTVAPAPPDTTQVMAIPPALRQLLQEKVIAPGTSRIERMHRLVDLLFSPNGIALQYQADATHTVAETYATGTANCLSFTLMFVALAREAGIDAQVQEVGEVLSWYQDSSAVYNARHVNARVQFETSAGSVDLDRSILAARRGPKPISDERALAHFYNNRASELMAEGEYAQARQHLRLALQLDDRFVPALNNRGVLESREGNSAAAVADYQRALAIDSRNIPTLSNALLLYRRLGDAEHAEQLRVRLEQVRDSDPFQQYMLGMEAERNGDYRGAIVRYQHAVRLYRDAHQFHFALARAYFLEGDNRRAGKELRRAQSLSQDGDRQRYQAKLDSLRRWNQRATAHGH